MKPLIILLLFISFSTFAQKNEKDCMNDKHIDWKTEYIFFELSGLIEINGHIFKNDTCKEPVIWSATVNKITISKGEIEYTVRDCGDKNCKIIHLVEKEEDIIYDNRLPYYFNKNWFIRDSLYKGYNFTVPGNMNEYFEKLNIKSLMK